MSFKGYIKIKEVKDVSVVWVQEDEKIVHQSTRCIVILRRKSINIVLMKKILPK
jgi:hypothetical protein